MKVPCCQTVNSYLNVSSRTDRLLIQAPDAIHAAWQNDSVPMNARGGGQFVRDIDAHPVAFQAFDRGPMHLAVEAPAKSAQLIVVVCLRDEDVIDLLADEVKHFDAVNHAKWQRRTVEGDHRPIVPPRLSRG